MGLFEDYILRLKESKTFPKEPEPTFTFSETIFEVRLQVMRKKENKNCPYYQQCLSVAAKEDFPWVRCDLCKEKEEF